MARRAAFRAATADWPRNGPFLKRIYECPYDVTRKYAVNWKRLNAAREATGA